MLELWGMQSTPLLRSLPDPLWPGVIAPHWVLSMGQIELNCLLMLNLIAWNRTVFDIEALLRLNWVVWNRTVLTFNCVLIKNIFILNWIVWIRTVWLNRIAWNRNIFWQLNYVLMLNWIIWNRTYYLYKMPLVLNNLQSWYAINPNKLTNSWALTCEN